MAGVPFLTHAVGGVPELIHPDDHARVLVDGPNGKALARRILQVLQSREGLGLGLGVGVGLGLGGGGVRVSVDLSG